MLASSASKKSSMASENFSTGYSTLQDLQRKETCRHVFFTKRGPPQAVHFATFFGFFRHIVINPDPQSKNTKKTNRIREYLQPVLSCQLTIFRASVK